MNHANEMFVQSRSQAFSDAAIRRSLLGRAEASEHIEFESLLMLDDEFETRVYRTELELADDFILALLSKKEEQLFATRFAVTPNRERMVAVSNALVRSVSDQRKAEPGRVRWPVRFQNLFALDRPFAAVWLASIALVFFGGLFWLSLRIPSSRPPVISKQQSTQASRTPASTEKQFSHSVGTQTPAVASSGSNSSQQQTVHTESLQPDTDSSSKQLMQITKADTSIRLELTVTDTDHQTYRASLMTEAGQEVIAFPDLLATAGQPAKIVLSVPVELLQEGDYNISLTPMTPEKGKSPQRYSFQVKHE